MVMIIYYYAIEETESIIYKDIQIMNLKQNILILSCAALLTACGGGGGASDNISTAETTSVVSSTTGTGTTGITNPSNKAIQSGQITDNTTGEPLVNVKVSIGTESTITDAEGYYTLSNLTANQEVVVNFEKEGYLLGSTEINLKSFADDNTLSPNYLEFKMRSHKYSWEHESDKALFGDSIDVDAAYVDKNGNPYNGTMLAELTILDLTTVEGKTLFTGSFKGINSNGDIVQFESYGLISLLLEDNNGNALEFAKDEIGTLKFNYVSSSVNLDTIPMWYYDYDQGLWVEEGYAELQADGTYKGEISHLGTWALNKPLEEDPGLYRGRIIDENGAPVGDVRVYATGKNWVSSDLTTDENGVFELKVIPGEDFELTAYDYQDKFGASYNNTIAAVASGDVVEDRG